MHSYSWVTVTPLNLPVEKINGGAAGGGMKTRGFMEPNIKQQLQARQCFNAPPNPVMLLFMADL